ncbi:MAG TPA: hypothetical protein VMI06_07970 [Terriglobia bacterium]|nr:hypothetical protein [Terriglobia bacterium]
MRIHAVLFWALVVIVPFLGWTVVSAVLSRRLGPLYRQHIQETRRERLFIASISFFVAFAAVRTLTHAIRAQRGPFHNVSLGGRHIHHLVWGILLLLIVGYGWLLQIGTGDRNSSIWAGRLMSLLYGIGAALTLDEFALWLNLSDVYWSRQGRASIDAVILFGGLLSIGLWGRPFFHALTREAIQLLRGPRERP